jgi:hypothetical protein
MYSEAGFIKNTFSLYVKKKSIHIFAARLVNIV